MQSPFLYLVVLFIISPIALKAQDFWKPGEFEVAEVPDCNIFDIAISRYDLYKEIRYCPEKFNQLDRQYPMAGHFYYVHEYGHIILETHDEQEVDSWVCAQLLKTNNGYRVINAFLRHLQDRCLVSEPALQGHGTTCERFDRLVAKCLEINPYLCYDDYTGQFVE